MVYIRKNGNKYKIYDEGRKTLASFDTKEQAIAWTTKPKTIDFKTGFKLYYEYVDNQIKSGMIKEDTGNRYQKLLYWHVEPLILNIDINAYQYSQFLKDYLPRLSMAVSRTKNTPLSAETYKDVIFQFRTFLKYISDIGYDIGECDKIIKYRTKVPSSKRTITQDEFYTTPGDVKKLITAADSLSYKTLYYLALCSGARTNELLAACFDNFKNNTWSIKNTLGNNNIFEPNTVKTYAGFREIDLPGQVITMIQSLKLQRPNTNRLFNISKSQVKYQTQKYAARAGIAWQGGLSPFRKLSSSLVFDSNILSEKEFRDRYGWEDLKTFRKYYQRQTRNNVSVDGIFNKLLN